MSKSNDTLSAIVVIITIGTMVVTYVYGMYNLISNDNYSAKQLIIGGALPPYSMYVGGDELYHKIFIKEEKEQKDEHLLLYQYLEN